MNPALDLAGGTVTLTYANRGAAPVTFTTTAERYRADGPPTDTVASGGIATRGFDVAMGRGWYALSVTASGHAASRRRFTGRLENGQPGVTGS